MYVSKLCIAAVQTPCFGCMDIRQERVIIDASVYLERGLIQTLNPELATVMLQA